MVTKVKCSYRVPKFKPSRQKKFHTYLCFVIVFPLNVKRILAAGFEFGHAVTALYLCILQLANKNWLGNRKEGEIQETKALDG